MKLNNKRKGIKFGGLLVLAVIIMMGAISVYAENTSNEITSNVVRLHVLANSNSDADQALKLKVRDKVVEYLNIELTGSKSADESLTKISERLKKIETLSNETLANEGSKFKAVAVIGNFDFPVKSYGNITLPSGNYRALRIIIGEGVGANWWCVLFPPLCFVDASTAKVSEPGLEELKGSVSAETFKVISEGQDGALDIKVKFKIVDIFEQAKSKIQKQLGNLFK